MSRPRHLCHTAQQTAGEKTGKTSTLQAPTTAAVKETYFHQSLLDTEQVKCSEGTKEEEVYKKMQMVGEMVGKKTGKQRKVQEMNKQK